MLGLTGSKDPVPHEQREFLKCIVPINFMMSAVWWLFLPTQRLRSWLTWGCTRCSIVARSRPGLSARTAWLCASTARRCGSGRRHLYQKRCSRRCAARSRSDTRGTRRLAIRRFWTCPADSGAIEQGRNRAGAQRQPDQRPSGSARASKPRDRSSRPTAIPRSSFI